MTCFLVGGLVIVTTDNGPAVTAAALVAVPEDFHQVARHRAMPDGKAAPLAIAEVAFIGCLLVALSFCATIGRETVTSAQFPYQHAQSRAVGIGTSPEAHAIVLP